MTGRPPKFASPDEFEKLADAYFKSKEESGGKISWTGLCLAVGVSSRQTLEAYKKGDRGKGFIDPIKNALLKVENYYEEKTTGADRCFTLKNFGWTDKQEIDHRSGDGTMSPTRKASEMSDDELAAAIDADTSRSS